MTRCPRLRIILTLGLLVLFFVVLTPGSVAATPALDPPPPPEARCQTTGQGTTCFWELAFVREGDFVTCDEQGFSVVFVAIGTASYKMTYDEQGVALQEVRHVRFTGTLTNTVTGAPIPYEGRFNRIEDLQASTIVLTGLRIKIPLANDGTYVLFAGREFVELLTDTVIQTGPNSVEQVCALLT